MNALIEKILENRGITLEDLKAYENPEHALLENVDVLAEKLEHIRQDKKKIVVLPDYDMDGIMSATIGYAGLSELGFDVELFISDPADGYGFGKKQIDRLIVEHPGVQAILSCDCGIGCKEGSEYAISRGLEVLITDHHMEKPEVSPRGIASVVVDPCSTTDTYAHPAICGAHVLWQCLDRYCELYGSEEVRERLWWLRIFAGIGTISDIMPVLYENRALVRDAIQICQKVWKCDTDFTSMLKEASEPFKQAFRGVYTVCESFSEKGKVNTPDNIDEQFFGFYMAPTFNSAKRMDGDMSKTYGVFKDKGAKENVSYLYSLNEARKKLVTEKFAELRVQENELEPYCYVIDAPGGILGLLAMRVLQLGQVPCVVVSQAPDGSFHGSGRSPEWYPFLTRAASTSYKADGHQGAFGCSFPDKDALEELYNHLSKDVPELISQIPDFGEPQVDIVIADDDTGDISIEPDTFIEFVDNLDVLKPFGRGMEEPTFMLRFDAANAQWSAIGQKSNHLKARIDGMDVLCWNQANFLDGKAPSGTVEILGKLSVNEFRGNRTAQFIGDILYRN